MIAITRSLRLVAGLALLAALQTAGAQSRSADPQPISIRSDCPIEPHPIAINPDVVECHAKFAPLPEIPPEINTGNPQHLEILRARGDVLLEQLDRPEACGKGVKIRAREACAVLVYVIDEEFRQTGLPWTYVVKIYRAAYPNKDRLRDTVLFTVFHNNTEGRFGPGAPNGEVWELLADQRVTVRCKPGMTDFVRNSLANPGVKVKPDLCRPVIGDVRYRPVLVIGRGEAQSVLSRASIKHNFGPAP